MERAGEPRRLMAVCVTLGAVAQILQVLTQIPPPLTVHMDIKRNMILLVSVLGQLLDLFTFLPPSSLETQLPLKKYLHLNTLALLFYASPQTVCALLYQGISILWHHFNSSILQFPGLVSENGMACVALGNIFRMPLGALMLRPMKFLSLQTNHSANFIAATDTSIC